MNKKIFLTSAAVMAAIATPAFADIAANAVNPSCTEPTIGATIDTANLQAEWTANTIYIEWYDGDTKITPNNPGANTCTYDDEIVVPTNTMTKEGYTFTGWRVRRAAAAPAQQCAILSEWDYGSVPDLNTDYFAWKPLANNGYTVADLIIDGVEGTDNSSSLSAGQWFVILSNGTLNGEAICSSTDGSYATVDTPATSDNGAYCWCKATSYIPNGSENTCNVSTYSSWVNYGLFDDADFCASDCVHNCIFSILLDDNFRSAIFGQTN